MTSLAPSRPLVETKAMAWRPFPVASLPRDLRNYVNAVSLAMGADPAFVALSCLGVAAGVLGSRRGLIVKPGSWIEYPVLWVALVGESGTMKTPPLRLVGEPLDRIEARMRRDSKRLAVERAARQMTGKAGPANAPTPNDDGEPLSDRRLYVQDCTIEKLALVLNDNPHGTLFLVDELAHWFGGFTRYTDGGTSRAAWLTLHSVGPLRIDRKTSAPKHIYVPRACCSVVGTIQPGILDRQLTLDAREAGLASRLILCRPPRVPKEWTDSTLHEATAATWAAMVERLAYAAWGPEDINGHPQPILLDWTPEARVRFIRWYNGWNKEPLEGELAAARSKHEALCCRLAVLLSILSGNDHGPIELDVLEAAITITEWIHDEWRRIMADIRGNRSKATAEELLSLVESLGTITASQLSDLRGGAYPKTRDAQAALDRLVDDGLLVREERPPGPRGGRPTVEYRAPDPF